jgi:hypothetical protein
MIRHYSRHILRDAAPWNLTTSGTLPFAQVVATAVNRLYMPNLLRLMVPLWRNRNA